MTKEEILSYIKISQSQNMSDTEIAATLLRHGAHQDDIDRAFVKISQPSTSLPSRTSIGTLPMILGLLCILLVIGSSFVGYSTRRGQNLDQERLADFNELKYSIEDYYGANEYALPTNLTLLNQSFSSRTSRTNQTSLSLTDPETKKQYEYKILSSYSYELCTDFATQKISKKETDRYSSSYDAKTDHKKGYDCIQYEIPEYSRKDPYSGYNTTTPLSTQDVSTYDSIFTKPQSGETLCLNQPYTLEWEANSSLETIRLYIYKDNFVAFFDPDDIHPIGQQVDPTDKNSRLKGSYTWTVGKLSSGKILLPGGGYRIGGYSQNTSYSAFFTEPIVVSDCSGNSTIQ